MHVGRLVPAIATLRGWRFWWPHGCRRVTVATAEATEVPAGGETVLPELELATGAGHRDA
jgi:uncharacterized membrane protein YdfJ with MMPL/SSD domain